MRGLTLVKMTLVKSHALIVDGIENSETVTKLFME